MDNQAKIDNQIKAAIITGLEAMRAAQFGTEFGAEASTTAEGQLFAASIYLNAIRSKKLFCNELEFVNAAFERFCNDVHAYGSEKPRRKLPTSAELASAVEHEFRIRSEWVTLPIWIDGEESVIGMRVRKGLPESEKRSALMSKFARIQAESPSATLEAPPKPIRAQSEDGQGYQRFSDVVQKRPSSPEAAPMSKEQTRSEIEKHKRALMASEKLKAFDQE